MTALLDHFQFALSVTGPTFIYILLGLLLRRVGLLGERAGRWLSFFTYQVGLPLLLCVTILGMDLSSQLPVGMVLLGVGVTLLLVLFSWLLAPRLLVTEPDRGVFVQGAYRGNLIAIGLAFCGTAFGVEGLAVAALPMAAMTFTFNVLAVVVLQLPGQRTLSAALLATAKNPIMLAIFAGVVARLMGFTLSPPLAAANQFLSKLVLPVALLCIGASMSLQAWRSSGAAVLGAVLIKLLLSPLLMVAGALLLGLRGIELGVMFLLAASPTAVASFIMVAGMGGNKALAANIVVLSSLAALLSVTLGLVLLARFGLLL
jgi:predicted permease